MNENHEAFIAEAQDVLRAGLETSPWVSVDDTGEMFLLVDHR